MTCTLGEVKNRADFILYWGGNPAECHPRHFTKYTLTQKGRFVPQGRKGRTMVLVDIRETPTAKAADIFLQIKPGKDFELATTLRALMKGQRVDEARASEIGVPLDKLRDLVDRMKRAKFGVIFFGMGFNGTGIAQTPVGGRILASLALERKDRWSQSALVGLERRSALPPEPARYFGAKLVRMAIRRRNAVEIRNEQPGFVVRAISDWKPGRKKPQS